MCLQPQPDNESEVNKSHRPDGVTNHSGNRWMSYSLHKGAVKGFGEGFGINYNGHAFYNDNNNFSIPEFATLKASLFYNQSKFRLSSTVNNLSDKKYWNNLASPQMPPQVLGSVSVHF